MIFNTKLFKERVGLMKRLLILILFVLFCSSSVFGGEFEDTLKSAEQGNVFAQNDLGVLYYEGKGVSQDYKKAVYWFTKSADQGDDLAQFNLGFMYRNGEGVPQDYKQAVYWYKKSSAQGNVSAQSDLGSMYDTGKGVTQDTKKAVYWYTKAAKQGYALAQFNLGFMYTQDKGVLQDYKKAVYWYTKSAKQGYSEAQYALGLMYGNGKGVTQDYKKAVYWYTKSAEQGYSEAQDILFSMYFNGEGVTQDYKQAVYWLKKSADQGDDLAQFNLGFMYSQDKVVTQDYKQSVYWYTKSAKQGYSDAQYMLGLIYVIGKGVPQNYKLAYVWANLAASQGNKEGIDIRDTLVKKLTPQQISEAQELTSKIQYKIDNPTKSQEQQSSISKINGSGTGFIITRDGYILTCHHVIKDANQIKITVGENRYSAKLVRDDPNNDLALLKINGSFPALAFSQKRSAKMGQEVFTIGYPNPSLQGINAKFTKGTINSLTGFQDDLRLYQISVPVQPGNSGGALVDENGNILGVIVAMLSAKATFNISGSLPQNVNYAVKSTYAQAMLDTMPEIGDKLLDPSRSKAYAIDRVKKSTVMVLNYR